MTPRLAKEIRPLVLPWVLAALAVLFCQHVLPVNSLNDDFQYLRWAIWLAGAAFLAARSFAFEFQDRTLALWLSQPVTRGTIWREKFMVLLLAEGALAAWLLLDPYNPTQFTRFSLFHAGWLSVAASIATAPFWAGVARTTFGTFVFLGATQFLVGYLTLSLQTRLASSTGGSASPGSLAFWLVYLSGTTVFLWAGWKGFQRLEAVEPAPSGALPEQTTRLRRALSADIPLLRPTRHGPRANLIRKELHLQAPNFIFAGCLVVVMALVAALDLILPASAEQGLLDVLRSLPFFVYALLSMIAIGSSAFCGEKALGTQVWGLTQPVTIRTQFLVKLGVSGAVFLVLGLLLPLTIIGCYAGFSANVNALVSVYVGNLGRGIYYLPVGLAVGFMLSFWVASLTPNVVRAGLTTLALAAVGTVTCLSIYGVTTDWVRGLDSHPFPWLGLPFGFASAVFVFFILPLSGVSILITAMAVAALRNFSRSGASLSQAGRQLIVMLLITAACPAAVALMFTRPVDFVGMRAGFMWNEQLRQALTELDKANRDRNPGSSQTYSWEQILGTGKIEPMTLRRLSVAPQTITVITLPPRSGQYLALRRVEVKWDPEPRFVTPAGVGSAPFRMIMDLSR